MTSRSSTREKLERLLGSSIPPTSSNDSEREEDPHSSLSRLERELLGEHGADGEALSVKERLERLVELASRSRPRHRPSTVLEPPAPAISLDELLPGKSAVNERGELYQVDYEFPLDYRHGSIRLSLLKTIPPSIFSVLARGEEGLDLDLTRTVFLDTETTGLAGGSGTCAFLVGIGYVEGSSFRIRQFFMRDYSEEEAMLHELAGILPDFESLVTFNGKTFDVPLLESRYVLARLRFPLSDSPHFDLLHPARNLWKARLESCRLTELEYALLGHEREDDVPGERIPGLYFDYVRSKDASRIFRVFGHNCHDILSLAALTVRASEMLDEDRCPDHPIDDYSLGRVFERASFSERSIRHYRRVVESGITGMARRRSLRQLAYHHKKQGEIEEAMVLWRSLSWEEGLEAVEALQELAMVLEHRKRDPLSALEYCERALSRLEKDLHLPYAFRNHRRQELEHRRRRLQRKIRSHANTRQQRIRQPREER